MQNTNVNGFATSATVEPHANVNIVILTVQDHDLKSIRRNDFEGIEVARQMSEIVVNLLPRSRISKIRASL